MNKKTKTIILIFLIIFLAFFIYGYIKLGNYIDRKWISFWYKRDLKSSLYHDSKGLAHFPKEIPDSATGIKYLEGVGRSGESFYLKMKMDKDWILKQVNSYSYSEEESYDNYTLHYGFLSDGMRKGKYTYYLIYRDKSNSNASYYYGLATNEDNTQIIYFYVNFSH